MTPPAGNAVVQELEEVPCSQVIPSPLSWPVSAASADLIQRIAEFGNKSSKVNAMVAKAAYGIRWVGFRPQEHADAVLHGTEGA